jgi:hypothetical protein
MTGTNETSHKGRAVLVQRVVFGALAVLCLAGWFVIRSATARADRDATRTAEARAGKLATAALAPIVTAEGNHLVVAPKDFADAVTHDIASEASFARVRVWDRTGSIAASSDPADRSGDPLRPGVGFRDAIGGEASSERADGTYTPIAGGEQASSSLLMTYVPLRQRSNAQPLGAVEVDFVMSELVSPALRIAALLLAAGAALFGVLFVLAMTLGSTTKRAEPPAIKKIEPPPAAPAIRHDFGAARRTADRGWVAAASDAPPPPTSVAELESATAKIAELERALQRAADENELVRSQAASQELDMERLRQEASERVAALEEQVRGDGPEIDALRAKLAEAEARAAEAETLLATAHAELAAAHTQVGDTRVADDAAGSVEPVAEPEPQPALDVEPISEPEPEPTDPTDLIAVLEARVAEAEARVQSAKEEAMQLSPEASDLRVRLARTAARKKMGASSTSSG